MRNRPPKWTVARTPGKGVRYGMTITAMRVTVLTVSRTRAGAVNSLPQGR